MQPTVGRSGVEVVVLADFARTMRTRDRAAHAVDLASDLDALTAKLHQLERLLGENGDAIEPGLRVLLVEAATSLHGAIDFLTTGIESIDC